MVIDASGMQLLAALLLYSTVSTDAPRPELRVEDYVKLTDKRERGERTAPQGRSDVSTPS